MNFLNVKFVRDIVGPRQIICDGKETIVTGENWFVVFTTAREVLKGRRRIR